LIAQLHEALGFLRLEPSRQPNQIGSYARW
jgi:hypothetical protein